MTPLFLAINLFSGAAMDDAKAPISCSAVIDAPVKDVWAAYTTTKGITSWMVPRGRVDMRVGGKFQTTYDKNGSLDGPGAIENTILSFDPEHMYSIKCTKTPAKFPFKKTMEHIWTVVYFRSVEGDKTEVDCRMLGWDGSDESNKMRQFFATDNAIELRSLVKHFKKRLS